MNFPVLADNPFCPDMDAGTSIKNSSYSKKMSYLRYEVSISQETQTRRFFNDATGWLFRANDRNVFQSAITALQKVTPYQISQMEMPEKAGYQKQLEELESAVARVKGYIRQSDKGTVDNKPNEGTEYSHDGHPTPRDAANGSYGVLKQISVEELFSTTNSWDGSEISKMLEAAAKEGGKVTVADITIQPGAKLPVHSHAHLMVARHTSGPGITVVNTENGETARLDKENPFLVELVDVLHYGFNHGETATQLSVTRIGPKDQPHTTIVKDQVH